MDGQTRVVIVGGAAFGDEGKGKIVDYLARNQPVHTIVRYGGPQAAHNVVTEDGCHHTFAHFGSGSLVPGVRTHLSRFMPVSPVCLLPEGRHLQALGATDIFDRLTLDREALVITPFQIAANRLRELARGQGRHGSCGQGVGETIQDGLDLGRDAIRVHDLADDRVKLTRKLRLLQEYKRIQATGFMSRLTDSAPVRQELDILESPGEASRCAEWFCQLAAAVRIIGDDYVKTILNRPGMVVFESSQGALLDEDYGFFPFCTRSNVSFANARHLLEQAGFDGETHGLGVLRTYFTRHGAGPFVTEDPTLERVFPEPHNAWGDWQQSFRRGHFDLVAARYGVEALGGVDEIALTHLDRLAELDEIKVCVAYDIPEAEDDLFRISDGLAVGIKLSKPDLKRSERITRRLERAKPVYKVLPADHSTFAAYLEHALGFPIRIRSVGPTAKATVLGATAA